MHGSYVLVNITLYYISWTLMTMNALYLLGLIT
jgi:hypothetical protein